MEDVVGKKIVFRDGWTPASTYLLLNYRDEGDGGLNFRDYLRDSIPVEEEKMTHGHADENSLVLLMSGGSVLLHDGGYRDYMPSGPFGAYRQDYFHNRLCVRPEKIWMGQKAGESRYSVREAVPGQGLLEFLRDAGSYRRVRTQKVDFLTFPDFDYSRTRLMDDGWGYESDRVVVYVKRRRLFRRLRRLQVPARGVFHPGLGLAHAEDLRPGRPLVRHRLRRRSRRPPCPPTSACSSSSPWPRTASRASSRRSGITRTSGSIHQTLARHFELGATDVLVTVLVPHGAAEDPQGLARPGLPRPLPPRRQGGRGQDPRRGGREIRVGVKLDLRMDVSRDWRRPRYTYEAGRIRVGDIETNGDLVFAAGVGRHA